MNGWIIVAESEKEDVVDKYWNGTVFEDDIEQSQFIPDRISARQTAGNLQVKNVELDVKAIPASLVISLGHASEPPADSAGAVA